MHTPQAIQDHSVADQQDIAAALHGFHDELDIAFRTGDVQHDDAFPDRLGNALQPPARPELLF